MTDLDIMDRPVKQVIVIRRDLRMRRGEEIAQGAHASMAWLADHVAAGAELLPAHAAWLNGAFTKIVCQVDSEEALLAVVQAARDAGVMSRLITDAGRTEFHGMPTHTAAAIGPDWADRVDTITRDLELY